MIPREVRGGMITREDRMREDKRRGEEGRGGEGRVVDKKEDTREEIAEQEERRRDERGGRGSFCVVFVSCFVLSCRLFWFRFHVVSLGYLMISGFEVREMPSTSSKPLAR